MKYQTTFISKKHKYTLGFDPNTDKYFLGIPVVNQMIDYIEHYAISKEDFDKYSEDEERALDFVEACRRREMDHLLLLKPGRDRGTPVY